MAVATTALAACGAIAEQSASVVTPDEKLARDTASALGVETVKIANRSAQGYDTYYDAVEPDGKVMRCDMNGGNAITALGTFSRMHNPIACVEKGKGTPRAGFQ